MATKKVSIPPAKPFNLPNLRAIRVGEFKPSLSTLSSVDCGVDLSSYAFAGLKNWK